MDEQDSKRIVSVRVNAADLEKIKLISHRLRVRESKVLRFAIRTMLHRLGPLHEDGAKGRELMSVFAELGTEIASYFEFDQARLEAIINGGVVDKSKCVERDDIALIAMAEMQDSYLYMKLKQLSSRPVNRLALTQSVRDYLFSKYVLQQVDDDTEQVDSPVTVLPVTGKRGDRVN